LRFRRSRRAIGEVNQSLAALVVIMMSVGLVLGAVHAASSAAADRAREERARLQADICLDAIERAPALASGDGTLSLSSARDLAATDASLAFAPGALRFATLRVVGGPEVWLAGSLDSVRPDVLVAARPVAVLLDNGTVAPGLLRVGVALP
jgi:hypothetical protein